MSRKRVLATGLVLAVCATALAAALTIASDHLYLPVLPLVDAALFGYAFFLLPVLATAFMALASRHSGRFLLASAAAGVVLVLSWTVWIGLIVVECGLQDNRCFD